MGRIRWHFPKIKKHVAKEKQVMKILEEIDEFLLAKDEMEQCVEALDILHAVETLIRQNFDNFLIWKGKSIVIAKNEARGYYEG